MVCETVDLYGYFNEKRPENGAGYLEICCHNISKETGLDRVRPAMLVIPGGAYAMVSDREGEPVAIEYLRHGFNTFVLKYTCKPATYPTQLREAAMAMIFIRENAEKYHIDPAQVAAIGFSAGGHLCGCLGTMFDSADIKLRNLSFVRPDAVILAYPVFIYRNDDTLSHVGSFENVSGNDEKVMKYLSLENHITANSSPAFIWHTVDDNCVPVYGSLVAAQKYLSEKVPFEMHLFRSGQHGLAVCSEETNVVKNDVRPWIELSVTWLKAIGFNMYS